MCKSLMLKNISKVYQDDNGETVAIKDFSYTFEKGHFTSIVGPSGCGKSTLLSIICGLEKASSGTIYMDNSILTTKNHNIGYMLQRDYLLDWRTIYKNVLLGLEIRKTLNKGSEEYANFLLEKYGLAEFKNKYPSQLSGGMRQRAALIRTLALSPMLLLLDEPFSALDYQTRLKVSDDIGKILKKEKKTAILVTHDISEAISMADRILILSPRPATVQKELSINLSVPDRTPLSSRNAPDFKTYFNLIWEELNHDA